MWPLIHLRVTRETKRAYHLENDRVSLASYTRVCHVCCLKFIRVCDILQVLEWWARLKFSCLGELTALWVTSTRSLVLEENIKFPKKQNTCTDQVSHYLVRVSALKWDYLAGNLKVLKLKKSSPLRATVRYVLFNFSSNVEFLQAKRLKSLVLLT